MRDLCGGNPVNEAHEIGGSVVTGHSVQTGQAGCDVRFNLGSWNGARGSRLGVRWWKLEERPNQSREGRESEVQIGSSS